MGVSSPSVVPSVPQACTFRSAKVPGLCCPPKFGAQPGSCCLLGFRNRQGRFCRAAQQLRSIRAYCRLDVQPTREMVEDHAHPSMAAADRFRARLDGLHWGQSARRHDKFSAVKKGLGKHSANSVRDRRRRRLARRDLHHGHHGPGHVHRLRHVPS